MIAVQGCSIFYSSNWNSRNVLFIHWVHDFHKHIQLSIYAGNLGTQSSRNRRTLQEVTKSLINLRIIQYKYSYLSNKRWVANNRRVWKKYLNLINKGSGTNGGPGIFATLYKEAFENSHLF